MERPFLHQALSHKKMECQSEHLQMRKSSYGTGSMEDSKFMSFADQLLYFKKTINTLIPSLSVMISITGSINFKTTAGKFHK